MQMPDLSERILQSECLFLHGIPERIGIDETALLAGGIPPLNAEYRRMQKRMVKVQDEARAIKHLMHGELPKLEKHLAETTGLFKGK